MASYAQVSQGSSGDTVKELQKKLNSKGYSLSEDGIFGAKTLAAVKDYQSKNSLQVDGIVGTKTWASLTGGSDTNTQTTQQATPAAQPDYSAYQYDSSDNEAYNQAITNRDEAYKDISTPTYDYDAVQEAFDKIVNRDKFSYDLNGDALYQQYKDQYTTQGKLAMMDAMGQAAALNGGYGSSYAQGAGQQAYQGYLQQLNEVVPELYQLAYDQYNQEGQDLLNQYAMTKEMADTKYGVAQDEQAALWQKVNYLNGVADSEYNKGSNNYYNAIQLGMTADETAYNRKQNEREFLSAMISSGYNPTDAELEAAGMTRGQSDSLKTQYDQEQRLAYASAYGGEDEEEMPSIDFKSIGYDSYDDMIAGLQDKYKANGEEYIAALMRQYVAAGYMTEEQANTIGGYVTMEEVKKDNSPISLSNRIMEGLLQPLPGL